METQTATQANTQQAPATAEVAKIKFCDKDFDPENLSVEFTFGNGETLTLLRSEVSDEIWNRAALHGILQKAGDSYAGAKGDYGVGVSACRSVLDGLRKGVWNAGREEGEGKPKLQELAEAMARIKQLAVDVALTKVAALDDDTRKALRAHPQVKLAVAQIRAEKAAAALAAATVGEIPAL